MSSRRKFLSMVGMAGVGSIGITLVVGGRRHCKVANAILAIEAEAIKATGVSVKVVEPSEGFMKNLGDTKSWSVKGNGEICKIIEDFEMSVKKLQRSRSLDNKVYQFESRNLGRKTGGSKHKKNPFNGWNKKM